jgi:Ser/Thr protein kinase RdoA (MazF antagonist)
MYGSVEGLAPHLEARYGISVASVAPLERWAPNGVQRIDRNDGPPWVARVFSADRPLELVESEAEMMRFLATHDYPAERVAADEAVSIFDGQPVLVTDLIEGRNCRGDNSPSTMRALGRLLGELHELPIFGSPAGSWHLMTLRGGPRTQDAVSIRASVDRAALDALAPYIDDIEDRDDLPQAIVHPDFCGPNIIRSDRGLFVIDWTGSGSGARISTLGLLLRAGGEDIDLVDHIIDGYGLELSRDEVARLPAAIREHGIVLSSWMLIHGHQTLEQVTRDLESERRTSEAIAGRVATLVGH